MNRSDGGTSKGIGGQTGGLVGGETSEGLPTSLPVSLVVGHVCSLSLSFEPSTINCFVILGGFLYSNIEGDYSLKS